MPPTELTDLYRWFAGYCRTFRTADAAAQRNYDLKEIHTCRVWSNSRLIAIGEGFSPRDRLLGEAAALLHDIGRFRQYREYGTFRDSDSVNHARLGVTVIRESGALARFPVAEREQIEQAVALHNAFSVPADLPPRTKEGAALLRDADKLDIWRVFSELFALDPAERASAATLGLVELPAVTPAVVATLAGRQMVNLSLVRTVNDYKLLLLSWVYDLNFAATARLVAQRNLVERLAATLPVDVRVAQALATVRQEVAERSGEVRRCSNSASLA